MAIAIEEQAVQATIQVIVMCHVSLRATRRVVLVNSTPQARERCAYPGDGMAAAVGHAVQHQQIERLVDAAVTGDEATIHVGLTDVQRWIDHKAANCVGIAQSDGCFRA